MLWCQHSRVGALRARWIATSVVAIEAVVLLVGLGSDRLLVRTGHGDLVSFGGETWVLLLGVASAAVVGFAIVRTEPRHPVGWLFLALSATILVSGPLEAWIEWGRLARPGSLPATGAVAAVNDATWIPWFVLVALILLPHPYRHLSFATLACARPGRRRCRRGGVPAEPSEVGPVRIAVPGHREPLGCAGDPAGVRLGRVQPGAARGGRSGRFRCVAPAALASRPWRRPSPAAVARPRRGAPARLRRRGVRRLERRQFGRHGGWRPAGSSCSSRSRPDCRSPATTCTTSSGSWPGPRPMSCSPCC